MMWIVLWTITVTVPTECPDYKPDPYTGQYPMMSCGVYHCETVNEDKSKSFKTREEAQAFIDSGPKDIEFRLVEGMADELD